MPAFQYKAINNKTGQMTKNTVNGITKEELYDMPMGGRFIAIAKKMKLMV